MQFIHLHDYFYWKVQKPNQILQESMLASMNFFLRRGFAGSRWNFQLQKPNPETLDVMTAKWLGCLPSVWGKKGSACVASIHDADLSLVLLHHLGTLVILVTLSCCFLSKYSKSCLFHPNATQENLQKINFFCYENTLSHPASHVDHSIVCQ